MFVLFYNRYFTGEVANKHHIKWTCSREDILLYRYSLHYVEVTTSLQKVSFGSVGLSQAGEAIVKSGR